MVVNILVNASVLIFAIYIYFKINNSTTKYHNYSLRQHLFYTVYVSAVGMVLMHYSIIISEVRFDFRALLFAISIRYFGWKTTLPSIVILTLGRFLWGHNNISLLNVLLSLYLMVSLPILAHFIKNRFSKFMQLFILLSNNVLATSVATYILLPDHVHIFEIMIAYGMLNFFLLVFCNLIIDDLSSMVSKINQDCLTSLNNQRRFHEDLEIMNDIDDKITIAILDIDYFKAYNDSFGHDAGDVVLQKVSNILLQHTSPLVNGYRVGGEEFAIVIVGHSRVVAEEIVANLHQAIMDMEITGITESVIKPTVSIGVAHVKVKETAKEAYKRADAALYQAKNNGRNQVQLALKNISVLDSTNG